MNQACTEVKYKMPEQEEVVEEDDSDDGEKVVEIWKELGKGGKDIWGKQTDEMKPERNEINKMDMKLSKYFSGVNKKGQEIEMTSPVIYTMKREKVSFTYDNAVLTNIIPMHCNVVINLLTIPCMSRIRRMLTG